MNNGYQTMLLRTDDILDGDWTIPEPTTSCPDENHSEEECVTSTPIANVPRRRQQQTAEPINYDAMIQAGQLTQIEKLLLEKPGRPLNAYNLFFRFQRDRILNNPDGVEGTEVNVASLVEEGKTGEEITATVIHITEADVLSVDTMKRYEHVRRHHRKTHGKIGFTQLSRIISSRWKQLSTESRQLFEKRAGQEKKLYDQKLKGWNKLIKQHNRQLKKHAKINLLASTLSNSTGTDRMVTPATEKTTESSLIHSFKDSSNLTYDSNLENTFLDDTCNVSNSVTKLILGANHSPNSSRAELTPTPPVCQQDQGNNELFQSSLVMGDYNIRGNQIFQEQVSDHLDVGASGGNGKDNSGYTNQTAFLNRSDGNLHLDYLRTDGSGNAEDFNDQLTPYNSAGMNEQALEAFLRFEQQEQEQQQQDRNPLLRSVQGKNELLYQTVNKNIHNDPSSQMRDRFRRLRQSELFFLQQSQNFPMQNTSIANFAFNNHPLPRRMSLPCLRMTNNELFDEMAGPTGDNGNSSNRLVGMQMVEGGHGNVMNNNEYNDRRNDNDADSGDITWVRKLEQQNQQRRQPKAFSDSRVGFHRTHDDIHGNAKQPATASMNGQEDFFLYEPQADVNERSNTVSNGKRQQQDIMKRKQRNVYHHQQQQQQYHFMRPTPHQASSSNVLHQPDRFRTRDAMFLNDDAGSVFTRPMKRRQSFSTIDEMSHRISNHQQQQQLQQQSRAGTNGSNIASNFFTSTPEHDALDIAYC